MYPRYPRRSRHAATLPRSSSGSVENRRSGFTLTSPWSPGGSDRRAIIIIPSRSAIEISTATFYLPRGMYAKSRKFAVIFCPPFAGPRDAFARIQTPVPSRHSEWKKKSDSRLNPFPSGASSSTFLRSSIMRAKDSNPIFYFATRLIRASSGRGKKRGRKLQPTHCPALLRVSELLW